MKLGYKKLGDYIRLVDERNRNLEVETLLGLSMRKEFRKSTSNVVGTDMANYKIVRKDRFACDFMSVIRVFKLPVVLQTKDEAILVSPAYSVFEVMDKNALMPKYLMLWFRRSEFDRYCFFKCDSAVRGGFNWTELCETEINIPSLERQKEIIAEYETVENRIQLNKKLCTTLEDTAQTIYKDWFEDFEFPDENGNPYKSSGGEMVACKDLGREIPKKWNYEKLENHLLFGNGKSKPSKGIYPVYGGNGITDYCDNFNYEKIIVIGRVGAYCGSVFNVSDKCWVSDNAIAAMSINKTVNYDFQLLQSLKLNDFSEGTGQPLITQNILKNIYFINPQENIINQFEEVANVLFQKAQITYSQTQKLEELKSLLLGKMALEN